MRKYCKWCDRRLQCLTNNVEIIEREWGASLFEKYRDFSEKDNKYQCFQPHNRRMLFGSIFVLTSIMLVSVLLAMIHWGSCLVFLLIVFSIGILALQA